MPPVVGPSTHVGCKSCWGSGRLETANPAGDDSRASSTSSGIVQTAKGCQLETKKCPIQVGAGADVELESRKVSGKGQSPQHSPRHLVLVSGV